ncbi:MAG: cell surface protein SprA, partial [Bacteroidetes bacterium]
MMGMWFALPQTPKFEKILSSLHQKGDSLPKISTKEQAKFPPLGLGASKALHPVDTPQPYRSFRLPFYQSPQRYQDYFSQGASKPTFRFNQFQESVDYQRGFGKDTLGHYYKVNPTYAGKFYKNPFVYDERDYRELQKSENERQNWREIAGGKKAETALTGKDLRLKIPIEQPWFERLFGEGGAELIPLGFVNLDFGIQNQRTANPNLPLRQQRMTTFNFDPHANINVSGKVGSKLRINGSFDTKASFNFENAFKIDYQGNEEDIIRDIDFGNVTFTLPTTLIQGGQNLFGLSTELQFGRLKVRSVFSQQRSRAETISLRGGSQRKSFSISCGDYEDNKHFFLSQHFRRNYEFWLSAMPRVISGLQITRLEVYVINRVNNTQDIRNAVAFLDLGESSPKFSTLNLNPSDKAPRNDANKLPALTQGTSLNADQISTDLAGLGFVNGEDFEMMRSCRKLLAREYTYSADLGYISLLTPLRNDEAIAVAYEYTLNGKVYRVGELTDDYAARGQDEVIKLKMLRPKSIRLDLPTWDLMMKNIYSLGATSINKQNFLLRVVYRDDLTGIDNPTLQEGARMRDQPLLRVMNLDRLNTTGDPQPDGNMDFIDNITMDTRNGRVIFPVLEPFGSNLVGKSNFTTDTRQLKFDPVA